MISGFAERYWWHPEKLKVFTADKGVHLGQCQHGLHLAYTVLQPELSDAEGNLGSMAKSSSSFW